MIQFRPVFYLSVQTCLLAVVGCGSSAIVPKVDPEAAIDAAMAQYDTNGDGMIDQEELAASPSLRAALAEIDTTGDKTISREELALRIKNMYSRNLGLTSVECWVTLKKRPLAGANVRFIPESFMGQGTTMEATGVTGQDGLAKMAVPTEQLPDEMRDFQMMQVGYYRVEITHPSGKLPARFNTDSQLGFEVHPDSHERNRSSFNVEKK